MAGVSVKIVRNAPAIQLKIDNGKKEAIIAVTEAVVQYGNIFVRVDQGTLKNSSLIASRPQEGKAVWDTSYAKKVYFKGNPSKDVNPQASLRWAEKGVSTYRKDIDRVAQNAFNKGFNKT